MKKLLLLILLITNLFSAEDSKNTISKEVYNQLQKANKLIEKKEYTNAKNILNPIVKNSENVMEKTYALQSLSNIYINQNNYKKVIPYYEKIIALNSLEKKDVDNIKFTLSKIHLSESNYKKSIKYSKSLMGSPHIKKKSLIENLALAYYYDGQYKRSSKYIKQVINFKKKKEQWYRMLYSSYIETKDYNNAITTLKYMVKRYSSKEEYWMQLISIYQTTKRYKKSLATLELVYKKKIVNQKDNLMYLVNILFQNNLYNKAALLMDESIRKGLLSLNKKNFNIIISSYLNAKNYKKAIPKLTKSKFANTDKYKLILGNIHYNNSNYKQAVKILSKYRFRKNSKIDGQRNTIIALSFYELSKIKESKEYLKKAIRNKFEHRRASSLARDLGYKI